MSGTVKKPLQELKKYYIIADLGRSSTPDEAKKLPQNAAMYIGKIKTIVEAKTWQEAMKVGKKVITGSLRKGITPFNWSWNEVDFVAREGDTPIYDKYPTATKLSYYRNKKGLTQASLAEASGVNIRQIQRVETGEAQAGNLTAVNLFALAGVLGIDPRKLI